MLWIEKYRPYNINTIIQQDDIKHLIMSKNNLADLPHLLFFGPSGIGKTTTALAICRYIFTSEPSNSENYAKILKERVLELNASDERGIKIVREKIKTFAAQALNNYKNMPSFKIIILDEADVMTNDSQFALRRIMEQYSQITRFILICNYVTKIIPPLSSRCSRYRFNSITLNSTETIIKNILIQENVKIDDSNSDNIINTIYKHSNGDLRKAITLLQRSVYISNINNCQLNNDIINEVACKIPDQIINNIYNNIIKKNSSYMEMTKIIKNILGNGYSASDVLNNISVLIMNNKDINDSVKSLIFLKMSDISNLLSNGSGDFIQLLTICSYINYVITH